MTRRVSDSEPHADGSVEVEEMGNDVVRQMGFPDADDLTDFSVGEPADPEQTAVRGGCGAARTNSRS
jgi:hypothetical protein